MKAMITGAAKGLGQALSEKLLQENCDLVAVDNNPEALSYMAQKWRGLCDCRNVDLADGRAVDDLMQRLEVSGPLDLVVLNAGISATGNFEELPASIYQQVIAINTLAPIVMAVSLMQQGLIAKGGTIVLIASLSNAVGYPGASVYAASKDALACHARSARKAFKQRDVNLLTVFPGPIRTDHAERHAPIGADASKRMAPDKLAGLILQAVAKRKRTLYPGFAAKASHVAGRMMPGMLTKLMRKIIFEKLEGPRF